MEENKTTEKTDFIDLRIVFKKIWNNKQLFYKVLPTVFILSCIYILSIPRYYETDVTLAPEMENSGAGGTLSSIASSFGFDLSEMQTTDAITPLLYPNLMEDNKFVTRMFDIKVKNVDGDINTTFKDYLKKHQKNVWWRYPIQWVKDLLPKKEGKKGAPGKFNPYYLSEADEDLVNRIRNDIEISINKKSGIISISTKAQDPLICQTLADSVKEQLQQFIIDYRTNKARTDYNYYKKLADEAKIEYKKARQHYASMSDASTNVSLRSIELKLEDMENDMQMKFNAYTLINNQLQAAKAKVQERTPAFTVMKGAAVPVKPAGPKRMIFVAGMLFLSFVGTIFYIIKDDILAPFLK